MKFREGQKVRRTHKNCGEVKVGEIYTVKKYNVREDHIVLEEFPSGTGGTVYFDVRCFESASKLDRVLE